MKWKYIKTTQKRNNSQYLLKFAQDLILDSCYVDGKDVEPVAFSLCNGFVDINTDMCLTDGVVFQVRYHFFQHMVTAGDLQMNFMDGRRQILDLGIQLVNVNLAFLDLSTNILSQH